MDGWMGCGANPNRIGECRQDCQDYYFGTSKAPVEELAAAIPVFPRASTTSVMAVQRSEKAIYRAGSHGGSEDARLPSVRRGLDKWICRWSGSCRMSDSETLIEVMTNRDANSPISYPEMLWGEPSRPRTGVMPGPRRWFPIPSGSQPRSASRPS